MTIKNFNYEESFTFCTQMSMVLSSGLSIQEGLEVIADDCNRENLCQACLQLKVNVEEEGSFYRAIQGETYVDGYMKQMIQIGEVSGHLDNVMEELASYYERANDLKNQLKEALLYPFVLLIMMWVVVGIIVFKVLPIFSDVLWNMGSPLPDSADTMMYFGKGFAMVSFVVLSFVLIGLMYIIVRVRKGEGAQMAFLSKFPLTKKLFHNISMARMTYALSLFISGGYDIEESISYLPQIVDEPKIKQKILCCMEGLKNGENFPTLLRKEKLYEGSYANMIVTGFHSGKSDDVMKKISNLYEKDVNQSISSFLNTIEPLIVIFLSLIVGVILLSVMLPLMSIMSSIG